MNDTGMRSTTKICTYGSTSSVCTMKLFLVLLLLWALLASGTILSHALNKAMRQTLKEQEIEDVNSVHKIDNHLVRRLIVMPLTDAFNPNQATGMHGKVQYGDKCSLPASLGRLIFEKPYEVPWLFEIKPINQGRDKFTTIQETKHNSDMNITYEILSKAYISPLDFRSPENYIFLPSWLMRNLNLTTNDIVEISFIRIKLASLVTLQPLTLDWDSLILNGEDPKNILEHEVNKYSSLTAGSTIAIEHKGTEYKFYIKETIAEGGVAVKGVRVQDSDVKVDIDRSYLDKLIDKMKENGTYISPELRKKQLEKSADVAATATSSAMIDDENEDEEEEDEAVDDDVNYSDNENDDAGDDAGDDDSDDDSDDDVE